MGSIKKLVITLLATVSVAVGSLAAVPNAYAMESFSFKAQINSNGKIFTGKEIDIYTEEGIGQREYRLDANKEYILLGDDYSPVQIRFIGSKIVIYHLGETIEFSYTYPFEIYTGDEDDEFNAYIEGSTSHYEFKLDGYSPLLVELEFAGDSSRPAIEGQENFVTSVEESKDIKYFIDFIKAIDDIDGDISHLIQIETDNYTPNKRVLGKHEVKIYVEDAAGNRSDFTFFVNVVDITKPVITGNSDVVQIGYKETYNIENFRKTLKVTDNYDSLTNADIKLKTDGYTSNKGKLGTWNVVFEAKDKSDNATTFTKPIKVYDNIAPVFSGTKEVIKSYTKLMTLDEILKEVSVNDEIDGNITKITVDSDTFTGNGNKVGTYEIRLSAKDNAGNIGYWTITVKVIDDQGANWWITNGVTVNLTPGATLTRTQIVELLAKTGQVTANKDAIVTYDVDTYSDNIGTPGLYTLGFAVKNLNGVSNSYTYGINVMDESNTDDENLDIEDDKSFIEKNLTWIIASGLVVVSIGGYLFIKKRK